MKRRAIAGILGILCAIVLSAPAARAQESTVELDFPLTVDRLPSYDRVNGLSLPFSPTLTFGDERVVVTPALTYRSHLGDVDPSLSIDGRFTSGSRFGFSLAGSRGTFTNDGWIRSTIVNSVIALGTGRDARNYYRADRAEARLTSSLDLPLDLATVFVGARMERAWSTGWRPGELNGPYSLFDRADFRDGIERPNPEIDEGHINSIIAGGHAEYERYNASFSVDVLAEAAGRNEAGGSFQQFTIDQVGSIQTIAGEHLDVATHLVATATGSTTPRQRYAYLGGAGSLVTADMLSLGGDRLYFVDALYVFPIDKIAVPILGNPYIAPHYAVGSAGVGGFGRATHNIGLRLGLSAFTLDYMVDPRTHQHDFGAGISLRP